MKRLKLLITCVMVFFGATSAALTHALTQAQACQAGHLCFRDNATMNWGRVYGNNYSWNFGKNNNWNKKADYYINNGRSNVCLYELKEPENWLLSRRLVLSGSRLYKANYASANNWISNSSTSKCNMYSPRPQ